MSPSKKRRIRIQNQKRGKRKGMKKGGPSYKDPLQEVSKQGMLTSFLKMFNSQFKKHQKGRGNR